MRITGGVHRGRRLRPSAGAGLRPTSDRVRGAIFSILGADAVEGARVADLFAGTGALGIEALSRGAAWADFVESHARRAREIAQNLRELSLEGQGRVHRGTVEKLLETLPGGYDLVLVDPPYDLDVWDWLLETLGKGGIVAENGIVVAEHRHDRELAGGYGRLVRLTTRRYGDTSVTMYSAGAMND